MHSPARFLSRPAVAGWAMALMLSPSAGSAQPGEAQRRSPAGAPLNLRIALPRDSGTPLEDACYRLAPLPPATAPLPLTLTLVEARAERYLKIESATAMPAGQLRFAVVSGCASSATESREYGVDIPAPPATPAVDDLRYALPGARFSAREGDTLNSLAQRFYPADKARQVQFSAALRAHNASLRGLAPDDGIPAGTPMVLPNLYSLSGIAPEQTAHGPHSTAPGTASATAAATARPPRRAARPDRTRESAGAAATSVVNTPAPAAVALLDKVPAKQAPAATPTPAPAPAPAKPSPSSRESRAGSAPASAPPPTAASRSGEFRLRLSSPEIDLAPSRRVTEDQRRALRQRHAILDADDQMAAMLALQNTLRQVEARLSDVERNAARQAAELAARGSGITLQASKSTSPPPGAPPAEAKPAAAAASSAPAPAPTPASTATVAPGKAAAAEPSKAEPGTSPAPIAASSVAAPPTTAPSVATASKATGETAGPAAPLPPRKAAPTVPREDDSKLPDGALLGGGIALLLALGGLWAWARRRNVAVEAQRPATTPPAAKPAAAAAESPQENGEPELDLPVEPAFEAAAQSTTRMKAVTAAPPPAAAPDDDDSTARFELDATPASHLDLALDDRPDEDRVRRLQYMYERFPELMSRTVSIDDADSVINSARLYYEEGQSDRACELLTFGVEERPQEVRFWLAQFEIFRLENKAAEFSALAAKFHVLFSYSPAWPKVRHIGHELDPANPLFAAGREVLGDDARFDPVVENWLHAPMDFTADALMSDLRRELFDEHNVDKSDFDSLSARLSPAAAPS